MESKSKDKLFYLDPDFELVADCRSDVSPRKVSIVKVMAVANIYPDILMQCSQSKAGARFVCKYSCVYSNDDDSENRSLKLVRYESDTDYEVWMDKAAAPKASISSIRQLPDASKSMSSLDGLGINHL